MDSHPLISVVMPSYDRSYFLRTRSIPSVLKQTYAHWELIVVGDGPEDHRLRWAVESFHDPRIRYLEIARPNYDVLSEREKWFVAGALARNFGLDHATGELVCALDDDDEFLEHHMQDCVDAFARSPVDVLYGTVLERDMEKGWEQVSTLPTSVRVAEQTPFSERIFHSTVCYSRSRFGDVRYPSDGLVPDDHGLLKQMWLRGAKFRKLGRPQCRSFGETFQTRYRLSVPSMPTPEEFMAAAGPVFTGKTVSNDGPQCREFERELADYLGAPVMTTPSGDLGLMVAFATLRSVQLQDGHSGRNQVIVPSYTHPSTVNALLWNQFEPVFCDIELETLCTSAAHVRPHLRAETAAICPVHAHGNPCDMAPLADLAREHGVALISDASAALSAELDGTPVGAAGDMEVFSFSGTKVLTCGEGGAICFGNERYRQAARIIGRYGVRENYRALEKGINAKLAELPAALGRVNLQRLPQAMRARRQAAARYRQYLQGLEGVQVQQTCTDLALSSCKDFALVFEETSMASRVAASLNSCRVDTRPYYRPLHQMPAFCRYVREPLPHTDHVGNNVLCIPIYNDIHPELVDMIAGIVKDSLRMKSVFGLSTDGRELLRRRPDSSEPYGIGLS